MELPQLVHEALIADTQKDRLIGHIARDSTAIEARERFPEGPRKVAGPKPTTPGVPAKKAGAKGRRGPHRRYKGGRPRASRPKEDTRLHRQRRMSLPECSLICRASAAWG